MLIDLPRFPVPAVRPRGEITAAGATVLVRPVEIHADLESEERVLIGHYDPVTGVAALEGDHYTRQRDSYALHRELLRELVRAGVEWLELLAPRHTRRLNINGARALATVEATVYGRRVLIPRGAWQRLPARAPAAREKRSSSSGEGQLRISA